MFHVIRSHLGGETKASTELIHMLTRPRGANIRQHIVDLIQGDTVYQLLATRSLIGKKKKHVLDVHLAHATRGRRRRATPRRWTPSLTRGVECDGAAHARRSTPRVYATREYATRVRVRHSGTGTPCTRSGVRGPCDGAAHARRSTPRVYATRGYATRVRVRHSGTWTPCARSGVRGPCDGAAHARRSTPRVYATRRKREWLCGVRHQPHTQGARIEADSC